MELKDQYDRIYKYLYFRLHDKQEAEDLTQESFLRFLGSRTYRDENRQLQYLYTIARNLCNQYYRKRTISYSLDELRDNLLMDEVKRDPVTEGFEQSLIQRISLLDALQKLSAEECEMLFLRYINEVPVSVLSGLYHISRFTVYRKLKNILKKIREDMGKEGQDG